MPTVRQAPTKKPRAVSYSGDGASGVADFTVHFDDKGVGKVREMKPAKDGFKASFRNPTDAEWDIIARTAANQGVWKEAKK